MLNNEKKYKCKYMLHARSHERQLFGYEIRVGGFKMDKRETIETTYGVNHTMIWQNIAPRGEVAMMQTQRWENDKLPGPPRIGNFYTSCVQGNMTETLKRPGMDAIEFVIEGRSNV